jgi:hypothetical protein
MLTGGLYCMEFDGLGQTERAKSENVDEERYVAEES